MQPGYFSDVAATAAVVNTSLMARQVGHALPPPPGHCTHLAITSTIKRICAHTATQVECPAGYYCVSGVQYECPPGTYQDQTRKTNSTDCKPCLAGYYCGTGVRVCRRV